MSLPRLWAFLAVALPTLGALIAGLSSVDLAYHLRAGAQILDTRAIPTVDSWTFTAAGQPWTDQQWGAQILLAAVYRVGGWTGLVLLRAGLVGLIFACLFATGRKAGLAMRPAALLTLAAFLVAAATLGLRPQLFGMALFAGVLLLVADRRAHPGRLWAIPILVLVWANVHGSFFMAPLVLGLAWLGDLHDRAEQPHRALVVAVVSALAACLTPFGPAVWAYAIGLSTNPEVTRLITEWQPTSMRDLPGLLFFGSVLGVVVLIARRKPITSWAVLAWLGVFFLIGAYAGRGVAWWSLAGVLPVAALLRRANEDDPRPAERVGTRLMRRLNVAVAVLVLLAGVALLPVWRPLDVGLVAPQGVLTSAPSGITAALRGLGRPGDRVLNPQPWGSWFELALPDLPVAIDSRIEVFPVAVWNAYENIASGVEGWRTELTDWGVTIAVIKSEDVATADRFSKAGWRSVYSDPDGSIMVSPGR